MGMSRITGCVAKGGMRPFMGAHPYSWIFQLLILVAIGLIIYWVFSGSKKESAMDIVKKRYAGGEITEKEFRKIRKVLG
jgi:putative membrane protein